MPSHHLVKSPGQSADKPQQQHSQYGCDGVESPLLWLVNSLPVPALFPRPWANQNAKNRKAAEGDDDQAENRNAEIKEKDIYETHHTCYSRAKQPNTTNADISDSDPFLSSQTPVGDGVNDSQVALHTCQGVKESLSIPGESKKTEPYCYCFAMIKEDTKAAEGAP